MPKLRLVLHIFWINYK